jgi:hypothetical protein
MSKYKVIKPLSRSIPNGFETFTTGDRIDLEDAEAARMIEAGIVEAKPVEESKPAKVERAEKTQSRELNGVETAVMPEAGVEKAVKAKGVKK